MSLARSTAKGANAVTAASTSPMAGSLIELMAVHARALRSCGARRANSKGRRSGRVGKAEEPGFADGEGALRLATGAGGGEGGLGVLALVMPGATAGEAEGVGGMPKFGSFFSFGSSLPRLER